MLDLYQAEKFFEKFTVRNRQTNRPVPFRLNPSQRQIMQECRDHVAKGRRLFVIFLKGRRLGVSTWTRLLMEAHVIEKEYSEGLIMAQQKITARALYEEFHSSTKQLPLRKDAWKYTQQEINFFNVPSKVSYQTAGNVVGTRGLGFTMVHASEAAFYENPDVFPAVLSTLSDDPENFGVIETTPNGKEGPGQAYYELWEASVRGDTEYLPIFLPWHDDPDYVRPAHLAKDAPRDDYEKYLMKELKLSRERIAFYRVTLHSKCGGQLDKWRRDYPGDPEEAFSVSGDPVFNFDDLTSAKKQSKVITQDFHLVELEMSMDGQRRVRAVEHREGRIAVFERPRPGAHYFAGVVIGHGDRQDTDSAAWDDTLAVIVWNGETGKLAARLHCVLRQESATQLVFMLGTYYSKAKIACEDGGGGFGSRIFQELRDRWRYHNQYRWKGRNDKVNPSANATALGFSINDYTRRMMLTAFLTSLRRQEIFISDHAFAEQMSAAQWDGGGARFDAIAQFDEILYAGLVGWIAKDQWHPNQCQNYLSTRDETAFDEAIEKIAHQKSPFFTESGILTMRLRTPEERMRRRELERDGNG